MTELTDRLRVEQEEGYTICGEAADEIEHLMLDLQTERAAVVALRAELANARAIDVHSCHDGCTRAGCVNGRLAAERDHAIEQAAKNCDEVLRLRAERDALREDAERYRWLKTHRYEMDTLYRYANTDVFERELDLNIRKATP